MNQDCISKLLPFYADYVQWVLSGEKNHKFFTNYLGLCSNLSYYLYFKSMQSEQYYEGISGYPIIQEHVEQHNLDGEYPFNLDGSDYCTEADGGLTTQNPKRMAWAFYWGRGNEEDTTNFIRHFGQPKPISELLVE